jgi:UDP-N-acetyl-D-mannosaminuronate dehydrogenase
LARLFATKYPVVGFDINQSRINGLLSGTDGTGNFGRSIASVLDKTHVTIWRFKFKTNQRIIKSMVCIAALNDMRTAIIISLLSHSVDKITVRI